ELMVLDAPSEGLIALSHQRARRQSESRTGVRLDAPFSIQAGHFRLLFGVHESHQHFDLPGRGVCRRIDACDRAEEFALAEAVHAEHHALTGADVTDAVGRHQTLETQAVRIDDLHQLLADLRGIARGDLSVADDAIERSTHLGALELLTRGNDARA